MTYDAEGRLQEVEELLSRRSLEYDPSMALGTVNRLIFDLEREEKTKTVRVALAKSRLFSAWALSEFGELSEALVLSARGISELEQFGGPLAPEAMIFWGMRHAFLLSATGDQGAAEEWANRAVTIAPNSKQKYPEELVSEFWAILNIYLPSIQGEDEGFTLDYREEVLDLAYFILKKTFLLHGQQLIEDLALSSLIFKTIGDSFCDDVFSPDKGKATYEMAVKIISAAEENSLYLEPFYGSMLENCYLSENDEEKIVAKLKEINPDSVYLVEDEYEGAEGGSIIREMLGLGGGVSNLRLISSDQQSELPAQMLSKIRPGHAVKKRFINAEGDGERMWVHVERVDEHDIYGQLASDPVYEHENLEGEIRVPKGEIIDIEWDWSDEEQFTYSLTNKIPFWALYEDDGYAEVSKILEFGEDGIDKLLLMREEGIIDPAVLANIFTERKDFVAENATPIDLSIISEMFQSLATRDCLSFMVAGSAATGETCELAGFNVEYGNSALMWAQKAAEKGDTKSWAIAATLVSRGFVKSHVHDEGMIRDLFLKGVEAKSIAATTMYGIHLLEGWGLAQDRKLAAEIFSSVLAIENPSDAGVSDKYRQLAESNLRKLLVEANEIVLGHAENDEKEWFLQAGMAYFEGNLELNQDFERAYYWLKKAADNENLEAAGMVGWMLVVGKGVEKDLQKGMFYTKKAAEHGLYKPMKIMAHLAWKDDPTGIDTLKWVEKIACHELATADDKYDLASFYDQGPDSVKNIDKALEWYRVSAEEGSHEAQCNLGVLLAEGKKAGKNTKEALRLLRLSTQGGIPEPYSSLGDMFAEGNGIPVDKQKALIFYLVAIAAGTESRNVGEEREKIDKYISQFSDEEIRSAEAAVARCRDAEFKSCDFLFE